MENKKMNVEEMKKLMQEQAEKLQAGELKLKKPIKGGGKELSVLKYDFSELTAWEYALALDSDNSAANSFRLTKKQAISLFAAAAAKKTEEVDAKDIKEQMGVHDGVQAANIATVFYVAASRADAE